MGIGGYGKDGYGVGELDYLLGLSGARAKCFKYLLSASRSELCIVYHNRYFEERFLFVFRTSRLCYRIYYEGTLVSKRTAAEAAEYLHVLLADIIKRCSQYKVMTVAELNRFTGFTYSNRMDLFRRLEELRLDDGKPPKSFR